MPTERVSVKVTPEVHERLMAITPRSRTTSDTISQALDLLEDERVVKYALRIREGRHR